MAKTLYMKNVIEVQNFTEQQQTLKHNDQRTIQTCTNLQNYEMPILLIKRYLTNSNTILKEMMSASSCNICKIKLHIPSVNSTDTSMKRSMYKEPNAQSNAVFYDSSCSNTQALCSSPVLQQRYLKLPALSKLKYQKS